jgi:hypothetical protein
VTRESSDQTTKALRFRATPVPDSRQATLFYSLLVTGFIIALSGLVAGFMYGDSYGRKHAQYDNPQLREYYSGQCYAYWESQFKKTVRQSLERPDNQAEQSLKLSEIRIILLDMQTQMTDLAAPKDLRTKKKVVMSDRSLTTRLVP